MPGTTPSPVNYSAVVDEVITQQYVTGEWNNTLKKRKLWKTLDETGAVKFDGSGKFVEWKSRIGEWTGFGYRADLAQRNFARKQQRVTYTTGWSFIEPDPAPMLSERDLQFLNTPENVTNFQNEFLTELGEDFLKAINSKLLMENTTANTVMGVAATATTELPLNGFLTLFSHGAGTAQNYNPDTGATSGNVAATDKEVLPNSTYCGVSTNPVTGVTGVDGQVRGSAAPIIINDTSTAFNGGSTYTANCLDVLDYAQARGNRGQGAENRINLALTSRSRFLNLKSKIRSSTTQQVVLVDMNSRSPNAGLYDDEMIPYNGLIVAYDEDLTGAFTLYLNTRQLKYRVFPQRYLAGKDGTAPIQGKMPAAVDVKIGWDIDVGAWKIVPVMCAQLTANPYFQVASYGAA